MNEALMKLLASAGDDPEPPKLSDLQMATRLKEIWALMDGEEPVAFTAGDLVAHKVPDMSSNRFVDMPGLFVRYLDEPYVVKDHVTLTDPSAAAHTAMTETYDCVILHLLTHGDKVKAVPFLAESRLFRSWVPEGKGSTN